MVDFHSKRITQSDYRGGGLKGNRDGSSGKLDLDLDPLSITDDKKEALRALIVTKSDLLLKALLPEHKQQVVRESSYLESVYTQLGI